MSKPQCQFAGCEGEAYKTVHHSEYGEIHVCRSCAGLWGDSE